MTESPFRWSDASVRRALGFPGGDPARVYEDISTDTRTLGPGDVFVALEGDRFDGHAFVGQAVAEGCAAVVSHREFGGLCRPRLPGPRYPHGPRRPRVAPARTGEHPGRGNHRFRRARRPSRT